MCEVNYTIQKKKFDTKKFNLKNNEQGNQIFVFEIILKDKTGEFNTLRKIKKGNQGNLISSHETIHYDLVDKINMSILNTNDINNEINIKIDIDHNTSNTTLMSHEIYLEFNRNIYGYLECNYNIYIY
jgi:hypothetical protein